MKQADHSLWFMDFVYNSRFCFWVCHNFFDREKLQMKVSEFRSLVKKINDLLFSIFDFEFKFLITNH